MSRIYDKKCKMESQYSSNMDEMKNIPEDCKSILKQSCILSTLDMVSKSVSQSKKTIKYSFKYGISK